MVQISRVLRLIIIFCSIFIFASSVEAMISIDYSVKDDLLTIRDGKYTITSTPIGWKSVNDYWDARIKSTFVVSFWDKNLGRVDDVFSYNAKRTYLIDGNTVKVTYNFPELGFKFTSFFESKGNLFEVKIPNNEIVEDKEHPVVSIDVLPYLNAGMVGEKGYLVIPDGCGVIIPFNKVFSVVNQEKIVYGDLTPQESDINRIPITLPVFSCIKNNLGLAGILDEGKEFSSIVKEITPGNGYYTVSGKFFYRKVFEDIYRKKRITQRVDNKEKSIKYYILKDKDANYVGVGKTYRDYLLNIEGVKPLKEKVKDFPQMKSDVMDISVFMGIKRGFELFDPIIKLTTFKDIETMLNILQSSGIKVNFILVGWEKSGFEGANPTTFPPFDGWKGLKNIINIARNSGSYISLSVNLFDIYQNSREFYRKMTLKNPVKLPVEQNNYRYGFIMCPSIAKSRFQRFYNEAKALGITSIELRKIGYGLIDCYDDNHPQSRFDTSESYSNMIESSRMVEGGCDYGIKWINHIIDAPSESSGFFGGDTIPLWEIALHGIVRYNFTPMNLRKDWNYEFLKNLEYGALPSSMVTYRSPLLIRDTFYKSLFSSKFSDWINDIKREYNLINRETGDLQYQFIIDHKELARHIYETRYESGTRIIVNYSTHTYQGIKPWDYRIIR
ncbi:MAG: DUF5696 domain-containing protein [bacterium]